MKQYRFRLIIIIAAVALSIYLLYPTYVDYQNNKKIESALQSKKEELKQTQLNKSEIEELLVILEDSLKQSDPSIVENRLKRLKLGLDLQGGMRVVLEVNTAKLLEKLANNPDKTFVSLLEESFKESETTDESIVDVLARKLQSKGIRLSRYFGNIRQDDAEIISKLKSDADDAVTRAIEIIRNRVDQYGVSEPSIQRQGARRVIVELPGVAKEEEAKQLLQGTALLEFRLVKEPEFTYQIMDRIDKKLAAVLSGNDSLLASLNTDNQKTDTAKSNDTSAVSDTTNKQLTEEEFRKQHPFFSAALLDPQGRSADAFVKEDDRNKILRWLSLPEIQKEMPDNVEFVFSAKSITTTEDGKKVYMMYLVNKQPELTGGVITDAVATLDPNTSAPIVNMEMDSEGAVEWARITGANINKRIAIMLDGKVFSAPVVRNKITGGRSQIEGMENLDEAKLLEIVLKAGALPAPVDIIEERIVGPSLGQDSVSGGLNSALLGYLAVALFMILYYRKSGTIAALVLVITILFVLGVLAGFKATLTLPGIAGIVLTIGMAVDANVLIFERMREELATGKTMKASVESGFTKAMSAIIDSNITTFFTGIILYQFGTGPVQGFALTLMIGIASTLFSALVISRLIFDYLASKGAKISIG
jgi:preprotein translocase subunit SecD